MDDNPHMLEGILSLDHRAQTILLGVMNPFKMLRL